MKGGRFPKMMAALEAALADLAASREDAEACEAATCAALNAAGALQGEVQRWCASRIAEAQGEN